jgi:ABC-type multidrug transport system fused ATPase/permease subunit
VTHRLGGIRRYDKVVVLHEGQIVEHDEPGKLLIEDSRLFDMYIAEGNE